MIDLIKEAMNEKTVFIDESKLNTNFVPKKLIHREQEFKDLTRIFLPMLRDPDFSQKNVLITGNNGTGKTALTKRFGISFEEISKDFNFNVKYIHANCRLKKSNYIIMQHILHEFLPEFPQRGFSLYEIIRMLKDIIENQDVHLIITLDELNFLDVHDDNLIYILNRLGDEELRTRGRISIIGIEKNLNFIKGLDLSTLSSFQYNIIPLMPYSPDQVFDILKARATMALKPDAITAEILQYIANVTSRSGDMRYTLELLYRAGKYADQKQLERINPECIRYAQANTFENFDFNSLSILPENEKIMLLSIARYLKLTKKSYMTITEFKQHYQLICEEMNKEPLGKSYMYKLLGHLDECEFISLEAPRSKKRGEVTKIMVDVIPVEILEAKLEAML
ncbi:AAA family ATPase [Candidatus Bathyarchaeota archaeon]|nr:AAA family ATPase [Candidatus Bathyarchaeota archaeon]